MKAKTPRNIRDVDKEVNAVLDPKLTVLVDSDPGARAVAEALPTAAHAARIRVLYGCSRTAAIANNLLVFSTASKLRSVAECVSVANKAHRLAALLVHTDVNANWLPYVLHHSGVRALRNTIMHSDADLPSRVLRAWAIEGENDFIADAAVIGSRLVVRDCAFKEYSIGFDTFPALRRIPEEARGTFVIEDDGLLLFWPNADVHLGLEDIRFDTDDKARRGARASRIRSRTSLGAAIKRLREEAGLRQAQIDGVSERHVRRVESGAPLSVETLEAYARSLSRDPDELLDSISELAEELDSHNAIESAGRGRYDSLTDELSLTETKAAYRALTPPNTGIWSVREPLRLAAQSSGALPHERVTVPFGKQGSVVGSLDHDLTTDELFFVVEEIHNLEPQATATSMVVHAPSQGEPIVSVSFALRVGTRIRIAERLGIVPGDVLKLELQPTDG